MHRHIFAAGVAAFAAVCATLPVTTYAQAVSEPMARCAALANDAQRLACYDKISGHSAAADASAVATLAATNRAPDRPRPSLIGERWGLDPGGVDDERFAIRLHNANYIIARYSNNPNQQPYSPPLGPAVPEPVDLNSTELKYQLSFKVRLWETPARGLGIWFGYTQQSSWQAFNEPLSRPFRETNYAPELMFAFLPDVEYEGFRWRLLNIGLMHQSNGRGGALSRSWNRAYAEFGVEKGNFAVMVRPWVRFSENSADDDNPDIRNYYGSGDIRALYRTNEHTFSLMARGNFGTGKGAGQFSYTSPKLLGPLRAYVQVFSGYGESLIDYNWRQTTIGAGVALNDFL